MGMNDNPNSLQALKALALMNGAPMDPTLQDAGGNMANWQGQPDALSALGGNVAQPLNADAGAPPMAAAPPAAAPLTREAAAAAARAGTGGPTPQVPGYYGPIADTAPDRSTVSRGTPASVPGATTPEGPSGTMADANAPTRTASRIPQAFMHRGGRRGGKGAMNGLAALSRSTAPTRA